MKTIKTIRVMAAIALLLTVNFSVNAQNVRTRFDSQTTNNRSGSQTSDVVTDTQTVSVESDAQAASIKADMQTANVKAEIQQTPIRQRLTAQQLQQMMKLSDIVIKGGLTLSQSELKLQVGLSESLTVKSGNTPAQAIKWESSNPSVVTVDSKGNIKGVGNGIASIVASTADGTKEGECKVSVFTKLKNTALGLGIDITKADNVSSRFIKLNNPIYDVDMLSARGLIIQTTALSGSGSYWVTAGETVSDVISEINSKNKVTYRGAFSASASVNFNTKKTTNRTTGFAKARGEVRIMDEYINTTDLKFLSDYLTKQFVSDIKTKSAAVLLDMYGSHVLACCYWGGVADLDYMYTSTKITDYKRLEGAISGSVMGFGGSSSTATSSEKADFNKNHTVTISYLGGTMTAQNQDQFNKQYGDWVNSVKSNPKVCGIDEFNEQSNMLPLWKIVELKNPEKAKEIELEFKKRLSEAEKTLNNIKIYVPVVTGINVVGQKGSPYKIIPSGYNHVVLFDPLDRGNDRDNVEGDNNKIGIFLDANKGRGSNTEYIHIFYNTKQTTEYNGNAIADIVMIEGANASAPAGYTKIQYDLNTTCGKDSKYLWLAVKKATASDTHIVDFIGGAWFDKEINLPTLPGADKNGKWEFVYKHNGTNKTASVADLAQGCGSGSKFIRLVMHKTPRQ